MKAELKQKLQDLQKAIQKDGKLSAKTLEELGWDKLRNINIDADSFNKSIINFWGGVSRHYPPAANIVSYLVGNPETLAKKVWDYLTPSFAHGIVDSESYGPITVKTLDALDLLGDDIKWVDFVQMTALKPIFLSQWQIIFNDYFGIKSKELDVKL